MEKHLRSINTATSYFSGNACANSSTNPCFCLITIRLNGCIPSAVSLGTRVPQRYKSTNRFRNSPSCLAVVSFDLEPIKVLLGSGLYSPTRLSGKCSDPHRHPFLADLDLWKFGFEENDDAGHVFSVACLAAYEGIMLTGPVLWLLCRGGLDL